MDSLTRAMGKIQNVVEMQLMHRATDYKEPVDRGREKKNVADNGTTH